MTTGFATFTEEHEAFRQTVRKFVERELRPHARTWEKAQEFPRELFGKAAELAIRI